MQKKIDQLTSLRFFAAAMIVLHHSVGLFGIKDVGINWGQGVTFFFILSGFILRYVYPELPTFTQVKSFWRARLARIWPIYLACFFIGFILIPYSWNTEIALANLLMIQSWIPMSIFYFSYNAVSWSISTEMFFYLVFPLIIINWNKYSKYIFLSSAILLFSIIFITNYLDLPTYGDPYKGLDGYIITQHALIYINPLSRIFEFILGIVVCSCWLKYANSKFLKFQNFYEIFSLLLCALNLFYCNQIAISLGNTIFGDSLSQWIIHSGCLFSFALLIYIMANGGGFISKILTSKYLIILGEISFSMYLIHQILLIIYRNNSTYFSAFSNPVLIALFSYYLISISYLLWSLIEVPGRKFINCNNSIHASQEMKISWRIDFKFFKRILFCISLLLITSFSLINYIPSKSDIIISNANSSNDLTPKIYKKYIDTSFDNISKLKGINITCNKKDLILNIIWGKLSIHDAKLINAVHITDSKGLILSQADYPQPNDLDKLKIGGLWLDTKTIPLDTLKPGSANIAIGIYDKTNGLLVTDDVNSYISDWGGRRLIFDMPKCEH